MNQKYRAVFVALLVLLGCHVRAQIIIPPPTAPWQPVPSRYGWLQLPTPSPAWKGFACSGDGKTVIGSAWYGFIYVSHDYGFTWKPNYQLRSANDFAVSSNGQRMWAASYLGLFQSNDGGATWTKNPMAGVGGETAYYGWLSVLASADNSVVVVKSYAPGYWIVSTNSGASWDFRWFPEGRVAMSADAKTMVGTTFEFPGLYVSHDYGATWNTNNAPLAYWDDVAVSPDGQTMVGLRDFYNLGGYTDPAEMIYVSHDGGDTWDGRFVPLGIWTQLICSADARTMMILPAPTFLSPFYISNDGGRSWKIQNQGTRGWVAGACSANGKVMYASNFGVGTYIHFSK